MAITKQQMQNAINSYKKQGKTDNEIIIALSKRKDAIGLSFADDMKHGTVEEFAEVFGLKYDRSPVDVNNMVNKNPTFGDKVKATATSVGMALAKGGGGAIQLGLGITDKLGITDNASEKYKQDFQKAEQATKAIRANAGRSGTDLIRLATTIAMETPFYLATSGMGAVARGGGALATLAGWQNTGTKAVQLLKKATVAGGTGGLLGAGQQADSAEERKKNIAVGAVGGAGGEVAGRAMVKLGGKLAPKVSSTAKANADARMATVVEQELTNALRANGMSLGDLPTGTANGLRADIKKALQSGKQVNQTAVARKVVFDRLGLTPTKAQLSGNAKDWQKQAELAKINGAGDALRDKFIQDNANLDRLLDDVVVGTGGRVVDDYGVMSDAVSALKTHGDNTKAFTSSAYHSATKADGNQVVLNANGFTNDAITQLDEAYALSSLPANVHKIIKDIDKNPEMFTLGKSEELIKILNREHRSSMVNGQATSATTAIGIVRDALEQRQREAVTEMLAQTGDDMGNEALNLYRFARHAYKMRAEQIEQIPLLKDAISGAEPDGLFKKHILHGSIAQLDKTVQLLKNVNPQVLDDIRGLVAEYIHKTATSSKSGQPSPVQMSRALERLGDRRLNILFNPDEVARLKDIEKAMDFMITQPAHSYVNNSNTTSSAINFLMNFIKAPGVRVALSPIKDVADAWGAKKAMQASVASDSKLATSTIRQIDGLGNALSVGGAMGAGMGSNMARGGETSQHDNEYYSQIPQTTPQEAPQPTPQPPIQPPNLTDLSLPPQDTSYLEKLGQPIDIGGMPTVANMPSGSVGGDVGNTGENVGYGENPEYGGLSGDYQNTDYQAVTEPKSQVALGNIAQGLYDLIPPPKETDNPRKQAVFEQFASSMVGRVLDTPQMQKIVDEFDNDEPNLRKIKALQKQLEHTPEWQSLLNTMPKEQRKHGSDILQYLTNSQIHGNSGLFNPTF